LSEYNTTKANRFRDFCQEEDIEGFQDHLDELHYVTMDFLAKNVTDRDSWDGYPSPLHSNHCHFYIITPKGQLG
jgi:hypothetical protein